MKKSRINNKFVMLCLHGALKYIHLKKDPVQIPSALSKLGFESFLVVPKKEEFEIKNIKIYEIKNGFPKAFQSKFVIEKIIFELLSSLIFSFEMFLLFKKIRPNLVISYFYPFLLPFIRFFSIVSEVRTKIICKLDWDGRIEGSKLKKISKKIGLFFVYLFSDYIIIESLSGKQKVLKFAKFIKPKLIVVPNGVSSEFIKLLSRKIKRKKAILCVALVTKTKGLELLLEAFSNLKHKHSDYKIRFVGPIVDKKYYEDLITKCHKLGIMDNVAFLGEIEDKQLAKEYSTAQIFCLPSLVEGFPISRMEALAAGLPIITTNIGGHEIIDGAGIIIKIGDAKGLTNALDKIMSNKKLRNKMSIIAKRIGRNFTWEKIYKRFLDELYLNKR